MWVHVLCNALNRVLMVHKEKKHLYFVNESFVDSNVFTSNVADADYDKVTARPYDWVLVGDKLEYRPLVDKELTAIQALVNLVDHKRWIYFEILNRINLARARYEELNILQLETYRAKYEQAVFLQKNDYDISAYNSSVTHTKNSIRFCIVQHNRKHTNELFNTRFSPLSISMKNHFCIRTTYKRMSEST